MPWRMLASCPGEYLSPLSALSSRSCGGALLMPLTPARAACLAVALVLSPTVHAQQKRLTIDDIYDPEKKVDFTGNPPTKLTWLDDAHYLWPKTDANGKV